MVDPSTLDVMAAGSGFGLSAIVSGIHNLMQGNAKEKEADKERAHEITLSALGNSYKDVKMARNMLPERDRTTLKGSFIGWTRRIIALIVVCLLLAVIFSADGISLPIVVQHHFFGVSWTTHMVQHLSHMAWLPCFPQLLFIVVGFYFGRMPSR